MSSEKQVSTPKFGDAVLQCALAHLLKSVTVDADDDSEKQHSFQAVEFGVIAHSTNELVSCKVCLKIFTELFE